MNKKRILLSIEPQVCKELLRQALECHADVEIVGESCNYIECLTLIAHTKPQLWIHSSEDGPDLKAMLSHAFEIAPNIVVVRVNTDEPTGYLQVQVNSVSDVLAFASLRHASTEPEYSTYN